eukprot:4544549-Prymnesium_polylepis.1
MLSNLSVGCAQRFAREHGALAPGLVAPRAAEARSLARPLSVCVRPRCPFAAGASPPVKRPGAAPTWGSRPGSSCQKAAQSPPTAPSPPPVGARAEAPTMVSPEPRRKLKPSKLVRSRRLPNDELLDEE